MNIFFSENTDRKNYKLNQFNEAQNILAQGRQELIFSPCNTSNKIPKAEANKLGTLLPSTRLAGNNNFLSTYNTQTQGHQEGIVFFSATSDITNLKSQSH